jgi:hypothetical protein
MAVFWFVAPCRLVSVYQRFRGLYCLHHQVDEWTFALMMEPVQTSETFVNSHQSTRRYKPEDSHLHSHRRENLKSYNPKVLYLFTRATKRTLSWATSRPVHNLIPCSFMAYFGITLPYMLRFLWHHPPLFEHSNILRRRKIVVLKYFLYRVML